MAAKWLETLEIVLSTSGTAAPTISAAYSLGTAIGDAFAPEKPSGKQAPLGQQLGEEEQSVGEEDEIPAGWEAPILEETLTYQVWRVPSIEGSQHTQLTGRSINNFGHVSGIVWFLDADPQSSRGFVWFGGEHATDANELIHSDDSMRETTVIADVMQINDEYYMAGLAEDPSNLDSRGRRRTFSFAFNGQTNRLHRLTEAHIWPYMAPDGRVVSEDTGDTMFIWDGESVYRWADSNDDSIWIDRLETCAVTVFDDRGLVYDFGTTENACSVRYEHLFMHNPRTDKKNFFHRLEGHERFSFRLSYVVDMNDHGQLLIDGCFDEGARECGLFVFTPITATEPN
jgi:hypothetical protein